MAAVETPSKQAASALSSITLNTPKKVSEPTFLSKLQAVSDTPLKPTVAEVAIVEPVETYRQRFVGDLECEEKDEPLLKESKSRFVLFPINYREVSVVCRYQNVD
jgi:ribonucleoside-diphosphate reductase subunit M2